MFAKSIIESDMFLDLPATARLLYFDLGMRGDDDGFVDSPKRIMKITGAAEDDLKILIVKQFIIPFENGIVVIRHWKAHNYLRSDRYKPTMYQNEMKSLTVDSTGFYNVGTPMVYQAATDGFPVGCIGKGNKGKDSIGKSNKGERVAADAADPTPYINITTLYNDICKSLPKVTQLSNARKKAIRARFNKYNLDDFKRLFEVAESSSFLKGQNNRNWTANFDWLIKDSNMAKVLDGNYADKSIKSTLSTAKNYDEPWE